MKREQTLKPKPINNLTISFINGNTSLILASQKGHLEVIKYLHKNGANIEAKTDTISKISFINGSTSLNMASFIGHLEVVKYLHKKGANIGAKNNDKFKNIIRKWIYIINVRFN